MLPVYNYFYYYNKDKCLEYSDFKYCKEFLDTSNLDYDQIETEFNEYIEAQKKEKEQQEQYKKGFDNILDSFMSGDNGDNIFGL